MDQSMLKGLSGKLFQYFDTNSIYYDNIKNECSCDIIPKPECFDKNKNFDKGLLIALVDTFSSYVVKFLCPNENYKHFLSLKISFNSYQNIKEIEGQKLKVEVVLTNKEERDILLDIKIIGNDKKVLAHLTHLKRRINI